MMLSLWFHFDKLLLSFLILFLLDSQIFLSSNIEQKRLTFSLSLALPIKHEPEKGFSHTIINFDLVY